MLSKLDSLDKSLFLFLNGFHADFLDPVMWYLSDPIYSLPVYGLFIYAAFKRYHYRGILWLLIGIGLVVLLGDNIHRECFKEVFERFRPSHAPDLKGLVHNLVKPSTGKIYLGGKYGFVSGHATNFVGITTFVCSFLQLNGKWKALIISWAVLICYSRIYLGVHYPGDILGGILLGLSIGYLISFLVNKYLVKPRLT